MKTEDIKEILHRAGIKNTPKKRVILKFLIESNLPISANSLHKECLKEIELDSVTVYRTLLQLKEGGVIKDIVGSGGVVHYEYQRDDFKAHPHFQCEECDALICLGALGFEDAIYLSNMANSHKVNSINLTLKGICEECQKRV